MLSTVATVLFQDHELRHTDFQQLPYHRIFIMLLLELNQPESVLEAINFQVLQTYSTVLHALKPSRAPGFAYAWLELISHRMFMSKLLLNTPQQKGWVLFQQLLLDLFKFLAPFLRNAELAKQTHLLYKVRYIRYSTLDEHCYQLVVRGCQTLIICTTLDQVKRSIRVVRYSA